MVEPNIIKTKYYTLVSADTGHGKTLWCKKKVARLLRTTQDRIIVIDVTGEYADFVLDHDRIVPGRIPMVMHQYKLSGGWPVDTHIIEVDMPMNRQPQLIVYDVSRTMGTCSGLFGERERLCLDPPSGMFITVDDALTFIPLDNIIGIKLPSGIVYP